jgi:hypothetical protein
MYISNRGKILMAKDRGVKSPAKSIKNSHKYYSIGWHYFKFTVNKSRSNLQSWSRSKSKSRSNSKNQIHGQYVKIIKDVASYGNVTNVDYIQYEEINLSSKFLFIIFTGRLTDLWLPLGSIVDKRRWSMGGGPRGKDGAVLEEVAVELNGSQSGTQTQDGGVPNIWSHGGEVGTTETTLSAGYTSTKASRRNKKVSLYDNYIKGEGLTRYHNDG